MLKIDGMFFGMVVSTTKQPLAGRGLGFIRLFTCFLRHAACVPQPFSLAFAPMPAVSVLVG